MNTKKLVAQVSKDTGFKQKDVKVIVNDTFDAIIDALKGGDKVQILGFGTFSTKVRPARVYPGKFNTDGKITPEKVVPRFSAGKRFKDAIEGK
jgi:DNA-binding protein HU-beta